MDLIGTEGPRQESEERGSAHLALTSASSESTSSLRKDRHAPPTLTQSATPASRSPTNRVLPIAEICRRHGVLRLNVFGSALRDDFRPEESNLDFLVELAPMEPYTQVDAYFGVLDDLRALLGPLIDLVMVGGWRCSLTLPAPAPPTPAGVTEVTISNP